MSHPSSNSSSLRHHSRPISGGGLVLLLDNGATITPEAEAMLQALYSRSPASVHTHLVTIAEKGAEKFMASYYVGYGHRSIGDCGSITLFIEGVSMLAAKAVQDSMLYSGQEVSTRYVDFSKVRFVDPAESELSQSILEDLRGFYLEALPVLEADLELRYPMGDAESPVMYKKAIKARAFDILRGFLPAGATTSVAWHVNLRQAADRIALLRHHPLPEVKEIADALEQVLLEAYPSSFGHKRYEATESYVEAWMGQDYYLRDDACSDMRLAHDGLNTAELSRPDVKRALEGRPPKTELPKWMAELGQLQFRFLLDFGSFRDVQRQRAVSQRMPLLTHGHGFEPWYLNELPETLRGKAVSLLRSTTETALALGLSDPLIQYYVPMGFRIANRMTGDLPSLVYLVELRAGSTVHPTLQLRARQMGDILIERLGTYGLKLYIEGEVGRFDVRRGAQDITKTA
jgi:thymidylate synthase ThyX